MIYLAGVLSLALLAQVQATYEDTLAKDLLFEIQGHRDMTSYPFTAWTATCDYQYPNDDEGYLFCVAHYDYVADDDYDNKDSVNEIREKMKSNSFDDGSSEDSLKDKAFKIRAVSVNSIVLARWDRFCDSISSGSDVAFLRCMSDFEAKPLLTRSRYDDDDNDEDDDGYLDDYLDDGINDERSGKGPFFTVTWDIRELNLFFMIQESNLICGTFHLIGSDSYAACVLDLVSGQANLADNNDESLLHEEDMPDDNGLPELNNDPLPHSIDEAIRCHDMHPSPTDYALYMACLGAYIDQHSDAVLEHGISVHSTDKEKAEFYRVQGAQLKTAVYDYWDRDFDDDNDNSYFDDDTLSGHDEFDDTSEEEGHLLPLTDFKADSFFPCSLHAVLDGVVYFYETFLSFPGPKLSSPTSKYSSQDEVEPLFEEKNELLGSLNSMKRTPEYLPNLMLKGDAGRRRN